MPVKGGGKGRMMLFNQENQLMTQGNIIQLIVRFSIPLLIGNLLQQSYQLVDLIIVGRYIDDGGLSVAAVGMGTSFINMMIGFFIGLSTGAGIVISNGFGAGKMNQVKRSVRLSILLAAGVSAAVSLFSILTCDWFLQITNTTEEIFALSQTYLKIYYIGFVPMLLYNMGTSVLQALGNSTSPFYYLLVTCILNIFLDIFFIRDLDMGVGGAAAATVAAQIVAMALILWKISRMGMLRKPEEEEKEETAVQNRRILRTMIRYGLPIAFQQVTVNLSNLILQAYVNLLGTQVIAAFGIFGKIDGFLLLPLSSFSVAITTFTGQNYGAGKLDRILRAKRYVCWMSAGVTLALSGIFILACRPIVLFFEDTPAVVDTTAEICFYMLPFYFLLALMRVYTGLFNGLGRPALGSVAMIACLCVARVIVISVIFPLLSSIVSIYISYYVSWVLGLVAVVVIFRTKVYPQVFGRKEEGGAPNV